MTDKKQSRGFMDRVKDTKTTRWIRFGVVTAIYLAWVIWMGNPWLLLLPFSVPSGLF